MKRRPPRGLSAEEAALWRAVTGTVAPLHPRPPWAVATKPPIKSPTKSMPEPGRIAEPAPRRAAHPPPAPAERPAPPPIRMDAKTHGRMRRGKLAPEARIDLHGLTLAEAHPRLTRFLLDAHARGLRLVLVITGKGRGGADGPAYHERPGALRRQVPHWLAQAPVAPVVLQLAEAHPRHGGAGAFYVYLRRAR
jgi:DNA-nicking Smr family endonuclease